MYILGDMFFVYKRFEDGGPNFGRQGLSGGLIYLRCTGQEGGGGGGGHP